ncbi:PIN domain-containing protein [Spirochaetia bacterium]|nr:PIN domain-containing protein [Spirochaetia bacterium]
MNKKIFIDSDIILDVLAERELFYEPAAEILDLGSSKKLELYTTAVVLANVFYFLRKKYGIEKSKGLLKKLRRIIKVLPIDEAMIDSTLESKFGDFEDGLQYFSAKESGIPIILTRNIKDYREKDVTAQTAEEYLKINQNILLLEEESKNTIG